MNKNNVTAVIVITVVACVLTDSLLARDLGAAATSAVSSVKNIARALSVFGVIAGGALMQVPGVAEFGKRTLVGGLLGCLCSFGGPAFISAIESIFGA